MPATVVLGTQWGDEGKGKAVDYLADRMDVVVRYQGGNNAGHTIIAEGRLLKLHLVPSGILYPHVTSVIADGVVVDPEVLLAEMDDLAAAGVDVSGLRLSLKHEGARGAPLGRVNVVSPGWTESPMTRTTLTDPELVRRVTRTMPLRKVAQPEDVARQVVVLASEELSGHVTGQVVTVAGGMEGRILNE